MKPFPALSPEELLLAARALVWARYGLLVRLSTLDYQSWQCLCCEADGTHCPDHPMGTGDDATGARATQHLIDQLHALAIAEDADREANRAALAAEFPLGFVWTREGGIAGEATAHPAECACDDCGEGQPCKAGVA